MSTTRLRRGFGIVATKVMRDPRLSTSAKALYAVLCTYADDEGVCYPSNETLARDLGVTTRTVQTLLAELNAAGVTVREERYAEGRQINSVTRLTDTVTSYRGEVSDPPGDEALFPPGDEACFVQNKTSKNKTSKNNSSSPAATGFAEWWSVYPRKVAKPAAEKAYAKAITNGATPDLLLNSLRQQVPDLTRKGKEFCPHPASWLNAGRWTDEPDRTPASRGPIPYNEIRLPR